MGKADFAKSAAPAPFNQPRRNLRPMGKADFVESDALAPFNQLQRNLRPMGKSGLCKVCCSCAFQPTSANPQDSFFDLKKRIDWYQPTQAIPTNDKTKMLRIGKTTISENVRKLSILDTFPSIVPTERHHTPPKGKVATTAIPPIPYPLDSLIFLSVSNHEQIPPTKKPKNKPYPIPNIGNRHPSRTPMSSSKSTTTGVYRMHHPATIQNVLFAYMTARRKCSSGVTAGSHFFRFQKRLDISLSAISLLTHRPQSNQIIRFIGIVVRNFQPGIESSGSPGPERHHNVALSSAANVFSRFLCNGELSACRSREFCSNPGEKQGGRATVFHDKTSIHPFSISDRSKVGAVSQSRTRISHGDGATFSSHINFNFATCPGARPGNGGFIVFV